MPEKWFQLSETDLLAWGRLKSPVWIFDTDHKRIHWANDAALHVWNAHSLDELKARDMGADMSESVSGRLRQYQEDFIESDAVFYEIWTLYPKGTPITLRVNFSGVVLADGRMAMLCEAVGEQKTDSETLRCAEALLHTTMMITLFSHDGSPLYRNPAARAATADGEESFKEHFLDSRAYDALMKRLEADGIARTIALVHTSNGKNWHEISARRCSDAVTGGPAWLISEVDVSELKRTEARAIHLASHDILTGLPNRQYVVEQFQSILEQARSSGQKAALMFIDLDRFKYVNDTIGHSAGDALLIEMARRLQSGVRASDVVARLGGDEFLVLTSSPDIAAQTEILAQRLIQTISAPCMIAGRKLTITPSIGAAFFPQDGDDLPTLMKHADMAMYHAKEHGRNRLICYQKEFNRVMQSRMMEGAELRQGLEKQQFVAFFQPRVDVATGKITGVEALARWLHPEHGLVSPEFFIPAMEEIGLISDLGTQIFEQAAHIQRDLGRTGRRLTISVNISPYQLRDSKFVPTLTRLVRRTKCNPAFIELEITESALLDNGPQTIRTLNQLKDIGFKLYIDDFGTGYSNLANLQQDPVVGLKIDKSFINVSAPQRKIASMIIMVAHAMGYRVVAEGIETEEQLKWLRLQDCDEYQGFYFSPPISAEALIMLLDAENNHAEAALMEKRPIKLMG